MSPQGWLALAIQAVILLTAIVGFLRSLSKIRELHISLNSRLDQLLAATAAKSHAEGRAEERAAAQEK
jgi:hypothetical protein